MAAHEMPACLLQRTWSSVSIIGCTNGYCQHTQANDHSVTSFTHLRIRYFCVFHFVVFSRASVPYISSVLLTVIVPTHFPKDVPSASESWRHFLLVRHHVFYRQFRSSFFELSISYLIISGIVKPLMGRSVASVIINQSSSPSIDSFIDANATGFRH